ncbi:hypothetical protein ACFL3Q_02935 [Planctomycetota bacterium]
MEVTETKKQERVQQTLTAIFETLVEDYGMEPHDVGLLMLEAGYAVAEPDGNVYMDVVIREIEGRIERPLSAPN